MIQTLFIKKVHMFMKKVHMFIKKSTHVYKKVHMFIKYKSVDDYAVLKFKL